jgi:hypothetical protein
VTIDRGIEIDGTLTGFSQGTPVCSCDGQKAARNQAGIDAYCSCAAGYSFDAVTKKCQECAIGSFKASLGSGSCDQCLGGTWTSKSGAFCPTCDTTDPSKYAPSQIWGSTGYFNFYSIDLMVELVGA